MTSYKPDPEFGAGSFTEDLAPIPAQMFTEAHELHSFTFDEDSLSRLDCPDCDAFCEPADLGEAVDWALGHQCIEPGAEVPGPETPGGE